MNKGMEYCRGLTCTKRMTQTPKKTVVVCGATGVIGSALVKHFITAGDRVIAVGRDAQKLNALNDSVWGGTVGCVPGLFADEQSAQELLADVMTATQGVVDLVITTMGALSIGETATQMPLAKLTETMADLTANFLCAKIFLPVLSKRCGSFIATTDVSGEKCVSPSWAATSVKSGAYVGLCTALRSEFRDGPARFYEVRIGAVFMEESKENLDPHATEWGPIHSAGRLGPFYAAVANSGLSSRTFRVDTLRDVEEFCPHRLS